MGRAPTLRAFQAKSSRKNHRQAASAHLEGIHLAQQLSQGAARHDSKHRAPDQNAGREQAVNISLSPRSPLAWPPGPLVVTMGCFLAWSRVVHTKRSPDPILKAPRAGNDSRREGLASKTAQPTSRSTKKRLYDKVRCFSGVHRNVESVTAPSS